MVFTDRHGGVSRGRYEAANLADHVGDEPEAVTQNRDVAARRFDLPAPGTWALVRQVHGNRVIAIDPGAAERDGDAMVTTAPDVPLVILTADCAPLALVADGAVAAVHAGWAGLEQGVIQRAVTALRELAHGPDAGPIRAVLGPCIQAARYEFGVELLERLTARFGTTVASRTEWDAPALDIPAAVRIALRDAGVDDLDDVEVCTAASSDHFSFRRDGVTGRQAMFVVRAR